MIQDLQKIFHSITKSLEVLYVLEDSKRCARILVFEDELVNIQDFLNKNSISFQVSDFKVLKQNTQSEFYSDKSIRIDKDDKNKGHFFVYISKDKETVQKAKIAESNNDHREIGFLLGYPDCCIDFFINNFSDKNTDLTLNILNNSDGIEFSFLNNICARHFDINLLSHFPHRFDCEKSKEIAKDNLKVILKHSKDMANIFENLLKSTAIYTVDEGIFLLRNFKKIEKKIIYSDVLTTARTKLYYLLSSNKMLDVVDKNHIIINEEHIKSEKFGVMVFI